MEKLLIVDGNSIANRAFYALPFLSNHLGNPSGAVYGFANILIKIIKQETPTHIVIAFDHARKTFRNEIYSEYKMQRKPTPSDLIAQFPIIKEMLKTMEIKTIENAGIEADDIIGTIAKNCKCKKLILSGDRDLLQLVDKNTTVWLTKKGVSEVDKVDEKRLKEEYGIKPCQVVELKALMGDKSDNIPGVKGIGEKTAQSLIDEYQNIDNIYNHLDSLKPKIREKLEEDKEMAFVSRQLATIKTDCDIDFKLEDCILTFPFSKKVYDFFADMDFTSLIKNGELFSMQITSDELKDVKKEKITSQNLNLFKNYDDDYFCYNLLDMEFCLKDKILYLDKNIDMFSDNISFDDVADVLKPVFESRKILKITSSAKQDMHTLKRFGITLQNYYDLSVGDYIINAGIKNPSHINVDEYYKHYLATKEQIKENNLTFIFNDIECPLIEILYEMEENGFRINEDRLTEIDKEYCQKLDKLTKNIYEEAGEEFNINSPKQVAYILFEKLGIKSYNNKKMSTKADKLDELRYIPLVDDILQYRKYAKFKNTYIDVYEKLIAESGDIIHTTFNQTLTSTGRLSSSEPNLQNIPTRDDDGKNLRKIFVSKFEGGKIISADYNQIELRLLADMSGEEELINAYKEGKDIHSLTASQIFGVDINKVTPQQRREAKAVNFGIIYGISDYGLSQNIKISRENAKKYIDSYFTRYPKVKEFMDNNVAFAKEKGYAVTKFGRIRKIPELSSSKYVTRSFGERVAMNMPLQGTASDIIKLAMIKVYRSLKEKKLKSQLILQIHDELIIDTFAGEEDAVMKILRESMESVIKLKVPLIVSMGCGESLYDCK